MYFAVLLPSRTDSCPYMSDAHQYPCLCLCLIYKEIDINLSCLRHAEQTTTSILHLTKSLALWKVQFQKVALTGVLTELKYHK